MILKYHLDERTNERSSAELLGFSGNNIDELFETMEETLDRLDTITEED